MDRFIGRLLDNRYEILEIIGTGGMAVVYKARCHRLNRLVAIKILKDDLSQDEEFRRRFHAESQAVAMLSHPNIVQVYDVSSTVEADYIVMELIDGITLKQYMEKKGVLNWKETLHFGMQIAKALEHAHSRGIVHRDIKPHNVMVLKNGSVKVADFGIAQVMSKSNTLTKEALGSVHYISPEQAKGGRVDNRSDIYSLGVVMYEMITGRPPYDGETPVAIAIKHINGGAVKPSVWNPNLPAGLEQIIMKAMAHDVADRYESATAMLNDMEAFRKEPSMLFGSSHAVREDPDKVLTMPINTQAVRTTAERVAGSRPGTAGMTGTGRIVNTDRSDPAPRQPAPTAQQRERQRVRREERQSRAATVAIVACSLVAVLAIVIFLVTLANGNLFNQEPEKVDVPSLLDKDYTMLPNYEGITIVLKDKVYHETYLKDRIIQQQPDAGDRVVPGTKVYITVSLGPEPQEKTMENLTGLSRDQAEQFLDGLGLDLEITVTEENGGADMAGKVIRTSPGEGEVLNPGQTVTIWIGSVVKRMENLTDVSQEYAEKYLNGLDMGIHILVKEENSETIKEGRVTRTEPAAGEEVAQGDTVTLWVSAGTGVIKAKMPKVLGYKVETALSMLRGYGFNNIEVDEVDSTEEDGIVLEQNYEPDVELDVTTLIKLRISRKTEESTAPGTDPTEPPVSKDVVVNLPESDKDFVLSIRKDNQKVVNDITVIAGARSITVTLTGSGTEVFDLYINDEFYMTQQVVFVANE
ncbi:MAG: Stk1 family PASTA domain-containing Ser/Thr kinase [Firmicutes bacterium]|nr:Stk1 family PASTA domain-containing Ser/Thr kinase [Bacillota bacterium]